MSSAIKVSSKVVGGLLKLAPIYLVQLHLILIIHSLSNLPFSWPNFVLTRKP